MKKHLIWHRECYVNWANMICRDEERLCKELERIKKEKDELAFYKQQITSAVVTGKEAFDRERYLIMREKK